MKVYLLRRADLAEHGEFDSKVVIASNEKEARRTANRITAGEGKIWQSVGDVYCIEQCLDCSESYVLLDSFIGFKEQSE